MGEAFPPFTRLHKLDWESLVRTIRREGTPKRVHHIELFQDAEIEDEIDRRYGVTAALDRSKPEWPWQRAIAMQRFLGYDYVPVGAMSLDTGGWLTAADTTGGETGRAERTWTPEDKGIMPDRAAFEAYPWEKNSTLDLRALEWFDRHLPDDMCLVARQGHFLEYLTWLMGYVTLCEALMEDRQLVADVTAKIMECEVRGLTALLQSKRVKIVWASDDIGFKTGLMISPADLRAFVFPGHKKLAAMAHAAGAPYLLHACGKRAAVLEDLLGDVKIDGLHSWEDVIEPIVTAKPAYGTRVGLLGGIDLDFIIRSDEDTIRARVRDTLKVCQPGGGYCLGTGNSVANYIPVDHYLAMLDEGRRWKG